MGAEFEVIILWTYSSKQLVSVEQGKRRSRSCWDYTHYRLCKRSRLTSKMEIGSLLCKDGGLFLSNGKASKVKCELINKD